MTNACGWTRWLLAPALLALVGCSFSFSAGGDRAYSSRWEAGSPSGRTPVAAPYSDNDVRAFVYKWFAGFDRQADSDYFLRHLPFKNVDMEFPDTPIRSRQDFVHWYDQVRHTIAWNHHTLSHVRVSGNERDGFTVGLDVRWQARAYDGRTHDLNIHQEWTLKVDACRQFIITHHRATVLPAP